MVNTDPYLPRDIDPKRISACLGLISDTHLPDRLAMLPPAVFEALNGVDLVLHSGDVGELIVLDQLSQIAPVLAVYGNDEGKTPPRTLPLRQVIPITGQRLLLYHGHRPDLAEEMESRKTDDWGPKLDYWFDLGKAVDAAIIVYGHTHIPMAVRRDGRYLINPGALASGSAATRQGLKTVARLYVLRDGPPVAFHIDLSAPKQVFTPEYDWDAGFSAAMNKYRYQVSILAPELQPVWKQIESMFSEMRRGSDPVPAYMRPLYQAYLKRAHRCWAGEQEHLTIADFHDVLNSIADLPADVRDRLIALTQ